jgi:hypothetical protein
MIQRAEELVVSVLTVPREPEYIHTTLASLYAADPWVHRLDRVNLYVGAPDHSYLDSYRHHQHLVIHALEEQSWDEVTALSPVERLCFNMRRALDLPDGAQGLLLLEDDTVFRDGFLQILIETVQEIEQSIGQASYVLAGYYSYDFGNAPEIRRGRLFTAYPCEGFYGTQCMYYPRKILELLREYVSRYGIGPGHRPSDMLVKKLGIDLRDGEVGGEGIYACLRPLAQHIGTVTTGLGEFHQTPKFVE